jgi:hypothetical protein
MKYPIVDSYEYLGISDEQDASHLFRIVGTDDELILTDSQIAILSNATEFVSRLCLWARENPSLHSPRRAQYAALLTLYNPKQPFSFIA